jgi:hypothetical protein
MRFSHEIGIKFPVESSKSEFGCSVAFGQPFLEKPKQACLGCFQKQRRVPEVTDSTLVAQLQRTFVDRLHNIVSRSS